MRELLELVTSWQALSAVVLVFGFLPGFVLRTVVLLYPREDPRRAELLAELYAMPRVWRPVWVAQQIETALWEGPPARLRARRERSANRAPGRRLNQPTLRRLATFLVTVGSVGVSVGAGESGPWQVVLTLVGAVVLVAGILPLFQRTRRSDGRSAGKQ